MARQHLQPRDAMPRNLYRYDIELVDLLDLRAGDAQRSVGLDGDALTGASVAACQTVGAVAYSSGREGVLARSATGSGVVLAVFTGNRKAGTRLEPTLERTWSVEQFPSAPSRR